MKVQCKDLEALLIWDGLAWHYRQFALSEMEYIRLREEARSANPRYPQVPLEAVGEPTNLPSFLEYLDDKPVPLDQLAFSTFSIRRDVVATSTLTCFLIAGFLLIGSDAVLAQVPQEVITTEADGAQSVYSVDLTDNGNSDVLSASFDDNKIAWYKNLGDGFFSEQKVITTDAVGAGDVYAADLTGNGDPDILSISEGDFDNNPYVAWYENNGDGSFSAPNFINVITNGDDVAKSVHVEDLNDDGNPDVLSAFEGFSSDRKVAWYENSGDGSFSDPNFITNDATGARSIYVADLNDDGNPDVLYASPFRNKIAWHENNGDGVFSSQNVITETDEPLDVYATDLSGNGNSDILYTDSFNDKIAWHENEGDGSFSEEKVITDAENAIGIVAADLNGDGNLDILFADSVNDKIAWHENEGDGSFSEEKIITTETDGAFSVYAEDLTEDGDTDILSASVDDDKIAWYENTDDVLPVELTSLSARANGTGAVLSWQTASETNNAGFYVQHSAPSPTGGSPDGRVPDTWERIGFVEGAGTTSSATSYRFTVEKELSPGTHRFRLRQVDTDGTGHFSDAVSLRVRMEKKVRLSAPAPNPIEENARLSFAVKESKETTVGLFNALGRHVSTLYRGRPSAEEQVRVSLNASGLSSGTYLIRLESGRATETRKITVIR